MSGKPNPPGFAGEIEALQVLGNTVLFKFPGKGAQYFQAGTKYIASITPIADGEPSEPEPGKS
jgi:hypothetical protein